MVLGVVVRLVKVAPLVTGVPLIVIGDAIELVWDIGVRGKALVERAETDLCLDTYRPRVADQRSRNPNRMQLSW